MIEALLMILFFSYLLGNIVFIFASAWPIFFNLEKGEFKKMLLWSDVFLAVLFFPSFTVLMAIYFLGNLAIKFMKKLNKPVFKEGKEK